MGRKRHDHIVGEIEGLISSGELKVGSRLPSERELAESCQVSRNTVREAIKVLGEKGVVESRRGSGTFVAAGAVSCMIDGAARRHTRLQDIFELRKILEPQIAALAARRITRTEIATLREIIELQKKAVAAGRDHVELDELFHRLLVRATGNTVLLDMYEALHGTLAESRAKSLLTRDRQKKSLESHIQLVQALEENDPDRAEKFMKQHMNQIEIHRDKSKNS